MAVTISNSPFHDTSIITYPYGIEDSSYSCGFHTGLDLVGLNNTDVYSVSSGTVASVNLDPNNALGIYVVIQTNDGKYFRYCHLTVGSVQVSQGQNVSTATKIGVMGASGTNVTGPHLHLEYSTTLNWACNSFLNPCDYLGIPNVDDTIIYYSPAPQPVTTAKKHKFKWVLYANKLRGERN